MNAVMTHTMLEDRRGVVEKKKITKKSLSTESPEMLKRKLLDCTIKQVQEYVT